MPELTIRDIAQLAKVSPATVSLALRNNPRISEGTRKRVQRIAIDCGYRVNPMISSLMSHQRATRKKVTFVASLAFITPTRLGTITEAPWDAPADIFRSAKARAAALGYALEEIPYREEGIGPHRLEQILASRNISGLIVHHLSDLSELLGIDWSKYSLVSAGSATHSPRLHHVSSDHYQNMALAMEKVRSLGYRRPGLCIRPFLDEMTSHRYVAAYLLAQQRLDSCDRISPLVCSESDEATFSHWIRDHKPDVVLCGNYRVQSWVERAGFRVPAQVGFVHLDVSPSKSDCSGILQNRMLIGATAINVVVAENLRNERGLSESAMATLIEGDWVEGQTVRNLI
ncbi:LacI family DNA-binding transcriptional regulator [Coraliomargarita algicola]|uniref:LacI family DNA-binding transcriptional regulator n=1 Tax=Coraliomargarita algicola TaxID=3092156 RepID=A0ABZ0RFX0_9BACT|nr:LacI family DNA-binding transcriptional regulator [Coraliomargarita sp. J2-16]WPJ95054.1 LacI family DNA-binding transcriptional regulator [Coraliomargarita sp. J2-16]